MSFVHTIFAKAGRLTTRDYFREKMPTGAYVILKSVLLQLNLINHLCTLHINFVAVKLIEKLYISVDNSI